MPSPCNKTSATLLRERCEYSLTIIKSRQDSSIPNNVTLLLEMWDGGRTCLLLSFLYFCRTATVRIVRVVSWKEIDFYRWNFVGSTMLVKTPFIMLPSLRFRGNWRYICIYTYTHTCHTRRNQRPGITRSENWWIFNDSRVRRTVFYGRGQLYLSSLPVQLGFKMKRFRYERERVFFFLFFLIVHLLRV